MKRPITHGTRTGYTYYKCRCVECKKANSVYQNDRQKAIRRGTWLWRRDPIMSAWASSIPNRGTRTKGDC